MGLGHVTPHGARAVHVLTIYIRYPTPYRSSSEYTLRPPYQPYVRITAMPPWCTPYIDPIESNDPIERSVNRTPARPRTYAVRYSVHTIAMRYRCALNLITPQQNTGTNAVRDDILDDRTLNISFSQLTHIA